MKNKTITIRTGLLSLVLVLISAICAVAQTKTMDAEALKKATPEQRATWQTDMMKEGLNLTDDQYKAVSKLNLEYAKKMQPLLTGTDSRFSRARKAKSLNAEKEEKLKKIFTSQQYALYKQKVKAMKEELKKAFKEKKG